MLSSEVVRTDSTGSGATLTYPYNFKIFDEDHLAVTVALISTGAETTLVIDTDYTVTGVDDDAGGNVVLVSNGQAWISGGFLSSLYSISIVRNIPLTQTSDIRNQGDFYPEVHEDTFDKLVMQIQQMQDTLDRSLKVQTTDYTDTLVLPAVADRASKFLAFDSSGDPIATDTVIPSGAYTITAFAETLLDDANAATARATLGFSGAGGAAPAALLDTDSVTTVKILALAVTEAKIAALAVTAAKLAADAVTTAKILDANVTKAKLAESAKYLTVATCTTTHNIATTTELLLAETSVSGYAITLPVAASFSGREITIRKKTNDFYQLTVADAAATLTTYLSTQSESITCVSDGTNWYIKERFIPMTWVAYTPTGAWTANTTYTGFWRRQGDSIELNVKVATAGAPTSASATILIPTGLTISTAKMVDATTLVAGINGMVSIRDVSTDKFIGMVMYQDTTTLAIFKDDGDATVSPITQAAPMVWAAGDFMVISVTGLPVAGAVAAWQA